jgi:hypothetical protein
VWATVTEGRPLPRIWLFPGQYPGAFVMTHTAAHTVSAGRPMLDWEAESELPSTLFAPADELGDAPERSRSSAGVLLTPPELEGSPADRVGIFGLRPLERPVGLEAQMERFTRSGDRPLRLARMAEGLWSPDYGASFRTLAGLGVDVDATYGPAWDPTEPEAAAGYSFGTGLPFQPLDRNGQLLPLLEVPTVLDDGPGLDADWATRLVDRAGRLYHELIVADWRTDTMLTRPRAEVISTWRGLYDAARERGLWITDLETFVRFWRLRSQARLQSAFNRAERRLTVHLETQALQTGSDTVLAPSIAFEARFEDRSIERITCNGQDVPFADLGHTADGIFQIYAPPPGTSEIEITYQGPIEIE